MLQGSLETFDLADILASVAKSGITGRLVVTRPDASGEFFFADGEIVAAHLEEGPSEDKDDVIDAAMTMLDATEGDFHVEEAEVETIARFTVPALLTAAEKRGEAWDEIAAEVDVDAAVGLARRGVRSRPVTLTPAQWNLVGLIDGMRDLTDLARAYGESRFHVAGLLAELGSMGLLEAASDEIDVEDDDIEEIEVEVAEPTAEPDVVPAPNAVPAPAAASPAPAPEPEPVRFVKRGFFRRRSEDAPTPAEPVAAKPVDAPTANGGGDDPTWTRDPSSKVAYPSGTMN